MIGEHKFVVDLVLAPLAQWSTRSNRIKVPLLLTLSDGSSLTWSAVRSDSQTKAGATYLYPFLLRSSVNNGTLRCFTDSLQDRCLSCVCPSYNEDSERDVWNSSFGLLSVHWYDRCESFVRVWESKSWCCDRCRSMVTRSRGHDRAPRVFSYTQFSTRTRIF
jgi:hypothetical protein